jgi:hypothetical protein
MPVLNSRPSVYEYRPFTNKYADASSVYLATAQQLYVTFLRTSFTYLVINFQLSSSLS